MKRILGTVPLFVDVDYYAKTVSYSTTTTAQGDHLAGDVHTFTIDEVDAFIGGLDQACYAVGAGETFSATVSSHLVVGDTVDGTVTFRKDGGVALSIDCIQCDLFVRTLKRYREIAATGIGDING